MAKVWEAQWIKDPQFKRMTPISLYHKELAESSPVIHIEDLQHHHMLVRKVFELNPQNIKKAYLDITADDYYKLYVNGKFVAQGPAQNYHFHYYYNRLDIKDFLRLGVNVIAVHVYYQGLVNRAYNSGDYRQGLLAEVVVDDQLVVKTDGTWKYGLAKEYLKKEEPFGYFTQFPEHMDYRLSVPGWRNPDFNDMDWPFAETDATADYSLVLQPTPVLSVYELKPMQVKKLGLGHYFIDFGCEITGQLKMRVGGKAGDMIEVRCGEELDDAGAAVRFDLRCNCTYKESLILSGRTEDLASYDYKGFRYAEVLGPEGAVDAEHITAVVRHYPFDDTSCVFDCSDKLLNDIFNMCKNGVKYGSQENYVDCPTREKGQYLGDNTIIGHSHMLLCGDLRLFRKAIHQYALSSAVCPGLMAVVPGNYMQEIADFSLQWPLQLLMYYQHSGDLEFLQEMLPYAEEVLAYFKQYDRGDGLLHEVKDKWNLVDWPEGLRDDYEFDLSKPVGSGCHNVINAFYYGCLQTVNEIRKLAGISFYDETSQLKERFLNVFYNSETKLFVDAEGSLHSSLHANMLPLLFGLTPDDAVEHTIALIKERRLSCGVYMAYFLLKALAKAGEYELIYDLISAEDKRSWGNMVKEGATTCFEAWGKDQKWNTSLCHPWASAPIAVLIEDIIGLKPQKPGWEEIRFTPHIPERLKRFSFHIHVRTGRIQVEYDNGQIHIDVPDGVKIIGSDS
jgi:alpha-L-rhamnosidase